MTNQPSSPRFAALHRMVLADHVCPWGQKTLYLLRRHGFAVEDHKLTTRAEVDAFKAAHDIQTTPQVFIDGNRIGGYDDLRRHLGLPVKDPEAVSYVPVLAVFAAAAALAVAVSVSVSAHGALNWVRTIEWFIAFAMVILAMLKLQDLDRFSTMFLGYDLLAQRWLPYAYLYPFLEFTAGVLMAAHALDWLSIPIALTIGTIGAVSVIYAVYVQKRSIKCACVGGSSRVPLGFVSLSENLAMVGMALWMLLPA